jgi:hypothetical protein
MMTSIKVLSLSFEKDNVNKFTRGFKCNLKAMHATTFEMMETNLTRMQMCYRSTTCVWMYSNYEHNVAGAYQFD